MNNKPPIKVYVRWRESSLCMEYRLPHSTHWGFFSMGTSPAMFDLLTFDNPVDRDGSPIGLEVSTRKTAGFQCAEYAGVSGDKRIYRVVGWGTALELCNYGLRNVFGRAPRRIYFRKITT